MKFFRLSLLVFLLGLFMIQTPFNIKATEGTDSNPISIKVSELSTEKDDYIEDEKISGVKFLLDIKTSTGTGFTENQNFSFETNLNELFDANWQRDFKDVEVKNNENVVIAKYSIVNGKFILTIEDISIGKAELHALIELPSNMYVKKIDKLEENQIVQRTLKIKNQEKVLNIKGKKAPVESNGGTIDMNQLWKNANTLPYDSTGSMTMIEVNPIASLDLYTGLKTPQAYDYFVVEDKIQGKGIIDESSLQIYAAIPTYKKATENLKFDDYFIAKDSFYAQRDGTLRHFLNKPNGKFTTPRVTKLEQNTGETYADFKARITANPLTYGIYEDAEYNQTFICNFGGIGNTDATKNNGILYSEYSGLATDYPDVFGTSGPTAGNIVSYYIEFNTYYPELVGTKQVNNYASYYTNLGGHGNNAQFTIDNSKPNSIGFVKKSDLSILVLGNEKVNPQPIKNAEFNLYKYDENGNTELVPLDNKLVSNDDGRIYVRSLPTGKYKLVQTSTEEDYSYTNNDYGKGSQNENKAKDLTSDGKFEIRIDDNCGHATIVTNFKLNNEKPTIEAKDIEIEVGSQFDPMMGLISATDLEDGDLKEQVTVIENTVNANKVGTYKLTYQVKDSAGNVASKTIKVVVKKKDEKPKPDNVSPKQPSSKNEGTFIVVNTATK